jgi:hypothetical protein
MTTARFEPAISASERPQTYALDLAATGIGLCLFRVAAYLCSVNVTRQTWLVAEVISE